MRSPITKITMLLFGIILSVTAKAQIVTTNPLEYVALAEGNELILGKVKDQMDGQKKTALLQNTIAAEFEQMRQWEKKYNSYLKTASGFASSLKACTHLYNDGVRIFISLCKLKKAISDNPQGIVAAMSMNNLYIETATELVTVFSLLRDAVAKGGKENMLTGAERSQTLWALNDQLSFMKIGYARVSTNDQNLDRQLDQLSEYDCERIFMEKITGSKKERPELDRMIDMLRTGDTVVITELTRLGRSVKDLFGIVEIIHSKHADIKSLKEPWLDTTTPQRKLLFTIFAGISQFDRDIIRQRTMEGLSSARARGRKGGRPKRPNKK